MTDKQSKFKAVEALEPLPRYFTPDHQVHRRSVVMDRAVRAPGISNAWTMPIRNRIEMQATGIRTPVGVKVTGAVPRYFGSCRKASGSRAGRRAGDCSAFAERSEDGYFLDFDLKRDDLARFGHRR